MQKVLVYAGKVKGLRQALAGIKVYRGVRTPSGCTVLVETGSRTYTLPHLVLHSPTGYEWGYGGSGPADLALSILADATGNIAYAEAMHQKFKWDVIARLDRSGFVLSEQQVLEWVDKHPPTWPKTARASGVALGEPAGDEADKLAVRSTLCLRCGRALKNPDAQQRGYGRRCWQIVLAEAVAANGGSAG